jgi:WD40 repeat protein
MSEQTHASRPVVADGKLRRPWWRLLLDAVFGYDFFISYSWADGEAYATKLALRLRAAGFEVCLDQNDFAYGDDVGTIGTWALRRTGQLILVGSPRAMTSDWVLKEIKAFSATGRRIVPIDFDGSLHGLPADSPLAPYLSADVLRIRESGTLDEAPSDKTFASILKTFNLVRQDKKRMRAFAAVAFVLGVLAVVAVWQAYEVIRARDQALIAQSRLLAEKAEAFAQSGDGTSAALIAMESLIDGQTGRARPSSAEALKALYSGFHARREIAVLASHSKPFNAIAMSQNGQMIAVGSTDGSIRIFNLSGSPVYQIDHGRRISSLTFSADGKRILVASEGPGAQQWDVEKRIPVGSPMVHDGTVLRAVYSPDGSRILTAGSEGMAKLWSADTDGSAPIIMAGHSSAVNDANFSSDGQHVVTASDDRTVRVWNVSDGTGFKQLEEHRARVRSASFDGKGLRIVSASDDRTAGLWDLDSGQFQSLKHDDHVFGASFSPDGSRILTFSQDMTARLWNASTDTVLMIGRPMRHEGWVMAAMFNAKEGNESEIVTAAKDGRARIWDGTTGDLKAVLNGHQAWQQNLFAVFDPSGTHVVTASEDGTARLWRVSAGVEITVLGPHSGQVLSASFSNDGSMVATGDQKKGRIWNINKLEEPRLLLDIGSTNAWSVVFSSDTKMLATTSGKGIVQLWDPSTGGKGREFSFKNENDQYNEIRTVDFNKERGWIVFGGHGKKDQSGKYVGLAQVFDVVTGEPVSKPLAHGDWVQSATFVPNAPKVLTASKDGKIRIWNIFDSTVAPLVLERNGARVFSAKFNRAGDRIVSSSEDGSVVIWEKTDGGFQPRLLAKLDDSVWTAVFSPDDKERWILTASFDNTARVYDASSGKLIAVMAGHASEVRSAAFSPDGKHVLTASNDGTARIWPVFPSKDDLIRHVGETLPRCFNADERRELSLDPAEPPVWCRTGFGLENEKDQKKWKPKWSRPAVNGDPS